MHHEQLTERQRFEIVKQLYRLRQEGRIGPIWCERVELLFIDVGTPVAPLRQRLRWQDAVRISRGEDWRQVLRLAA